MKNRADKFRFGWPRMPAWMREEWVWQGLLAILVVPVAFQTFLSLGTSYVA